MKEEIGTRLVVNVIWTCMFNKRRLSRRENMRMTEIEHVVTAIERPLRSPSIHLIHTSRPMLLPRLKRYSKKFAAMNDSSIPEGGNQSIEEKAINICCEVETLHGIGQTLVECCTIKQQPSFGNEKGQVGEVERRVGASINVGVVKPEGNLEYEKENCVYQRARISAGNTWRRG